MKSNKVLLLAFCLLILFFVIPSIVSAEPWTQMTSNAQWLPRYLQTSVALPDGSIVLMGGLTEVWPSPYVNDVWHSTDKGASWELMTEHAEWTDRIGHSSVVLPDGSIVLMGGMDINNAIKRTDAWRSTDKGASWELMTASAGWTGRVGHSCVVLPDGSIVLMGGSFNNDVWRSTDKGASWELMTAHAEWSPRQDASSGVLPDGSIVLMGGTYFNDVWRSTDKGATWKQMTASAEWSPRFGHTSVVMPDGSIVLMGGMEADYTDENDMNDVWRSTDKGASWELMTEHAEWTPRYYYSSVVIPDGSIIVMGGHDVNDPVNDVWRFVPSNEKPPVAKAGLDQIVIVNEIVAFDGSGSMDSDGTIMIYTWDFGDTNRGSGVSTSNAYTAAGTYTVTLTVTDNDGLTGSDTATITVKTPAGALQDLITKVDGLGLPKGIEKSLLAKLDVAEKKITQEQYSPARNTLNAFIKEVNAQRGKAITVTQANELSVMAQRIITSIPGK